MMQAPKLTVKGKQQANVALPTADQKEDNGGGGESTRINQQVKIAQQPLPPPGNNAKDAKPSANALPSTSTLPSSGGAGLVVKKGQGQQLPVPLALAPSSYEPQIAIVEDQANHRGMHISKYVYYRPDYNSMKINSLIAQLDTRNLQKERKGLNNYAKEQFILILQRQDEMEAWDAAGVDYDLLKLKDLIDLIDKRRYNRDGLKTQAEFIDLLKSKDRPRPSPLPPWPVLEPRCHPYLSTLQPKEAKNIQERITKEEFGQRDIDFWILAARGYEEGGIQIVRNGLAWGIPVDSKHSRFEMRPTALMMASQYNQTEIVQLLLNNFAEVNFQNSVGWTALHYASRWGMLESVKILIANKADVDVKDRYGRTSLDVLKSKNIAYEEVYKILSDLHEKLHPSPINFKKSSLVKKKEKEDLDV